MKKVYIIFLFFYSGHVYATNTPCKYVDGKIVFAKATVNGFVCWSDQEKLDLQEKFSNIGGTTTLTTVDLTPTQTEVAISTIVPTFTSYSDYKSSLTKEGLFLKFSQLKSEYDLAVDLGDTTKVKELKQKYMKLKEVYQTLP